MLPLYQINIKRKKLKRLLLSILLITSSLFAKEFIINIDGQETKEKRIIKLNLNIDEEGKLISGQKIDYLDINSKIKSLKIVTSSGLKGTIVDEREIIIFYKTSLNIQGLKIRNLYKVANARIYNDENIINIKFDKDYYQNIGSYLRYHNISSETIKDLNNLYGSWREIEIKNNTTNKIVDESTEEILEL
jgi:hypothetical protein